MALTKKDLRQINQLISDQLSVQLAAQDHRLRLDLREALDQQARDMKRDIRDEMDARFFAQEHKFDARFATLDAKFTNEIRSLVQVILSFFPERFESLEHDVVYLKRHVGIA